MKKITLITFVILMLVSNIAHGQNSPFYIWGTGLDGSTYQKTAIYSDVTYGLLFEAPKDASANKLPIQFNWRGGGIPPLYIKGSNSFIGLGTNNPTEKLYVNGNIEIPSHNYYVRTGAWNYMGSCAADYGYYGMCLRYRNDQWESFHSTLNGMAMRFIGNGIDFITAPANTTNATTTSLMTIKSNGNVAIQGKLEAKEIKVNLSPTADFVFEEDYELKEINEVETFIKINKHLPDFPSAKEIEKNGVNLGEMDAKLLRKIEELTLYMIEMNKEIKTLKEENKILKEKINLE